MKKCIKTSNALISALLIGVFGIVFSLSRVGLYLEEELGLTWLYQMRGGIEAPGEVVVVLIDKSSVEQLQLPDHPEKWPRSYYARLINQLNRYNPAIIAFNIYFGEDRDIKKDVMMAKAMTAKKNVILSNYLKQYSIPSSEPGNPYRYERIIDPTFVLYHSALATSPFPLPKSASTVKQFWTYKKSAGDIATLPTTIFQCYVLKTAYGDIVRLLERIDPELAAMLPDQFEPFVREFQAMGMLQQIQNSLADRVGTLQRLNVFLAETGISEEHSRLLRAWFEMAQGGDSLYFNYYGKVGSVRTIPVAEVLARQTVDSAWFDRKIVLVGYSDNLEPERNQGFYTVFSNDSSETVSATEIAATAVANLIDGSGIKPVVPIVQCLLVLLWSLILHGLCCLFSYRTASLLIVATSTGYIGSAYYLFATDSLWLPLFIPILLQAPLALAVITFCFFRKNRRDHENIHKAFGFYLPDSVVRQLTADAGINELGNFGKLLHGVCMATDADQYTSLSESLDPMALHALMNQYYGVMFPIVKNHQGFVSDVIGDAMLALWADSGFDKQHKMNACRAALAIRSAIERFNESHTYRLQTRLGLHFGEMRLGNVGSADHYEYRAIGDIVNTATRIENMNKVLGTQILVSADVIDDQPELITREMGIFILKGKTLPIQLFELVATAETVRPDSLTLASAFGRALKLFQTYQWPKALSAFKDIANQFPEDGPTHFYISYLNREMKFSVPKQAEQHPAMIEIGNITNLLHL